MIAKENVKWKQRAKLNWIQKGDKNSKYFHTCASQRHKKNWINQIRDGRNRLWTEKEDIKEAFHDYFKGIYTSSNPSREDTDSCLIEI